MSADPCHLGWLFLQLFALVLLRRSLGLCAHDASRLCLCCWLKGLRRRSVLCDVAEEPVSSMALGPG
jgi:hypothetical protein